MLDEDWTLPKHTAVQRAPVLFAALQRQGWVDSDWDATVSSLEASSPVGWQVGSRPSGGISLVFGDIWTVLWATAHSRNEQVRLADACRPLTSWIAGA